VFPCCDLLTWPCTKYTRFGQEDRQTTDLCMNRIRQMRRKTSIAVELKVTVRSTDQKHPRNDAASHRMARNRLSIERDGPPLKPSKERCGIASNGTERHGRKNKASNGTEQTLHRTAWYRTDTIRGTMRHRIEWHRDSTERHFTL